MLNSFFADNGIIMNGISIHKNASAGMHIRADRKLLENEVVARIPKSAILSTKNTAIADLLQEYKVGGLLGLTLALMFEKAQGSASPWYEYIISLPEKVDIPLLWDSAELDWLSGTELGYAVMQDQIALEEDYDSNIVPILDESVFSPPQEFSFEKFRNASSVVASRAFHVDEYHKQSMVPLADIFNHCSKENVHVQCNSNVCEFCGESGICDCEIVDHVNEMVNIDSKDMGDSLATLKNERVADNNQKGDDDDDDDDGIMEMVVVSPCEPNQEVFNTYGQHSNLYLLNRYGFCEENNPNDVINFDKEEILDLIKQLSIQALSKRMVLWEKLGRKSCSKLRHLFEIQTELGLSEDEMEQYDEEEYDEELDDEFNLDYNHQPSFHLYCFLHLMLIKSSTLEIFTIDNTKYESFLEKMAYKHWTDRKDYGDLEPSVPMALSIRQIIYILCENRLAKYPTTLSDDVKLYKTIRNTDQHKHKSSLILRISDKRILMGFRNSMIDKSQNNYEE